MNEAERPRIVSREEWERARAELLDREKEHTHASDTLAAARRRLPMTPELWKKGGGKVGCEQGGGGRSMVHRGGLSCAAG